jgi:cytochrome c biogenesis protein CcmG, thiol:disulfide interchange protein DsbE
VRLNRWLTLIFILPLALLPGCNRGSHPEQTGKPAPDFTVSDGSTSVHLASYRGQVVLVNFWASWCAPCVAELPSLIELHHDNPHLVILAISIDEDPEAYATFIRNRHVDLITVRDPNQTTATLFGTSMWPESYLIDRRGIIRRKFVGATDWSDPEIRAFIRSL